MYNYKYNILPIDHTIELLINSSRFSSVTISFENAIIPYCEAHQSDSVYSINLIIPTEEASESIFEDIGNNLHMPDISISAIEEVFIEILPKPWRLELDNT